MSMNLFVLVILVPMNIWLTVCQVGLQEVRRHTLCPAQESQQVYLFILFHWLTVSLQMERKTAELDEVLLKYALNHLRNAAKSANQLSVVRRG